MSNIEENAFQIARYLLENPNEIEQVGIQNALSLSEEDFKVALEYLIPKYFSTGGQRGKGIIRQKNFEELQEFVNQINEKRVSLSLDAERLLKFLFDSQTPASDSERTMVTFGWDEKRYLNALETLKFQR